MPYSLILSTSVQWNFSKVLIPMMKSFLRYLHEMGFIIPAPFFKWKNSLKVSQILVSNMINTLHKQIYFRVFNILQDQSVLKHTKEELRMGWVTLFYSSVREGINLYKTQSNMMVLTYSKANRFCLVEIQLVRKENITFYSPLVYLPSLYILLNLFQHF